MIDKIVLLPDSIANQIAAGEVIQRPASAVKELLENAVDAGATEIQMIVADAGKALLQVIDNGSGMSGTDARMCFERHATSKILSIDDLFHIRTMGFRGEALASIAAVAQVELKTRQPGSATGTYIEVENSVVKKQEPVAAQEGTSIAMKNLFFNVPARRNFLKSNAAEMRHILDEFTRVAMAFPHILFSLTANGQQLMHLEPGSLKQRIVQLLGQNYNAKLVTVKEDTDYMNIYGFVGKPDVAKKTRGDQFFFVNNRFIKNAYLNHAVTQAFQELLPKDSFPMYVLFIDLDPEQVDVNVHPTKQEIKFEDEKIVYAFVQAAVKHALAQFSITPTLDFDLDPGIQGLPSIQQPFTNEKRTAASSSALFKGFTQKHQAHIIEPSSRQELKHWKDFFSPSANVDSRQGVHNKEPELENKPTSKELFSITDLSEAQVFQMHNAYLVLYVPNGLRIINQQYASERVIYNRLQASTIDKPYPVQQSMFPVSIELTPGDAVVLVELLPLLQQMGYLIEPFGKNTFVIQGTPADIVGADDKHILDLVIEQYKHFNADLKLSSREKLLRSLARQQAVKPGVKLVDREIRALLAALFSNAYYNTTPGGLPIYKEISVVELAQFFD